jgi:hypothetical protein
VQKSIIFIVFLGLYSQVISNQFNDKSSEELMVNNYASKLLTLDDNSENLKKYVDKYFILSDTMTYQTLPKPNRKMIKEIWAQFNDIYFTLDKIEKQLKKELGAKQLKKIREILSFYSYAIGYDLGLYIIERTLNKPHFEILLDEPQPEFAIKQGSYADLKFQILHSNYLNAFQKTCNKTISSINNIYTNDTALVKIARSLGNKLPYIVKMRASMGKIYFLRNFADFMTDFQQKMLMPLQRSILDFFGDTRLISRHDGIINKKQCDTIEEILQPGDLLFERKEWYLSNIGIPGFWPHSALFIGNPEQLIKWSDDKIIEDYYRSLYPEFSDFPSHLKFKYPLAWEEYSTADSNGKYNCIVEAIGEGVLMHNIYESIGASDYLTVLRPKLKKKDIAQAIELAFQFWGRNYDFNFDFLSDNELVCSELVYKCYEKDDNKEGLSFELEYVMDKLTLAPNSMITQYCKDTTSSKLSFVTFYDANESKGYAFRNNYDNFQYSYLRPRWGYDSLTFSEQIREGHLDSITTFDRKSKYYQMPVNISLTLSNSLGLMFSQGKEIINYFSLNIFSGKSAKLRGLEIGLIWNYNSEYMNGVQISGIMNTVIEDSYGMQIAGLMNVNASEFYGIQFAGLANFTGSIIGIQTSLLTNSCEKLYGLQIAPLLNTALERSNGLQLGFLNISMNNRNTQIGFINTAGEMKGVQIGFANGSLNVKQGLQLGFFNINKQNKGVPLALFSYVDDVPIQYSIMFDEIPSVSFGIISGNEIIKNKLFVGELINSSEGHFISWGIATNVIGFEDFAIETGIDLKHLFRTGDKFFQLNDILQYDISAKINIYKKLFISFGPVFNYYYSESIDLIDVRMFNLSESNSIGNINKSWIGFRFSLNY